VKRLDFHGDVLEDEEDLMRTKALFHIKKSQDKAREERRQQDDEYKSLLSTVHEKLSAAELSKQISLLVHL
jgi:hypothetical protein